uniref:CHK kinase-like domain-containing protein n=1 Tax=Ditylenchus dipsaci TaxID=166011 RepID=A0A915E768_9BILA
MNAVSSIDDNASAIVTEPAGWTQLTTGAPGSPASFMMTQDGLGMEYPLLIYNIFAARKSVLSGFFSDLDKTTVLKVTFGWDNDRLPKSVVLKICERHEEDSPEESKLASRMFRRECHAYEWLSKQRKMCVPKVFVIKKQSSETCNALIVMEDLSERSVIGELTDGITVEVDLLRILAQIHALSMTTQDWTLLITEHTPFFYEQMSRFIQSVANQWTLFEEERFKELKNYLTSSYTSETVSESCIQLKIKPCMVHGNPAARNIFMAHSQKKVAAVIDWTQAHPGCYGEDIAKVICWNLTAKERHIHLLKLLQFYHYNLLKKYQAYGGENHDEITLDQVKAAYDRFVPLATVNFLMFLPEDMNRVDANLLERAKNLMEDVLLPNNIEETPLIVE